MTQTIGLTDEQAMVFDGQGMTDEQATAFSGDGLTDEQAMTFSGDGLTDEEAQVASPGLTDEQAMVATPDSPTPAASPSPPVGPLPDLAPAAQPDLMQVRRQQEQAVIAKFFQDNPDMHEREDRDEFLDLHLRDQGMRPLEDIEDEEVARTAEAVREDVGPAEAASAAFTRGGGGLIASGVGGLGTLLEGKLPEAFTQAMRDVPRKFEGGIATAQPPADRQTFLNTTLPAAAGSLGTFAGLALFGGVPTAAGVAISAGVDQSARVVEDRLNAGEEVDPIKATVAILAGGGLGATEVLPLGRTMRLLDKATGGRLRAGLTQAISQGRFREGLLGMFREGGQEIFQEGGQAAVEAFLLDVERTFGQSLAESGEAGAAGGILGFLLNAMVAGPRIRTRRGTTEQAQPEPTTPTTPEQEQELSDLKAEALGEREQAPVIPEAGAAPPAETVRGEEVEQEAERAQPVEKPVAPDAGDRPRVAPEPVEAPAVEEGGEGVREGGQAEVQEGAAPVAEEEAGAEAKQPWEMTREEFFDAFDFHAATSGEGAAESIRGEQALAAGSWVAATPREAKAFVRGETAVQRSNAPVFGVRKGDVRNVPPDPNDPHGPFAEEFHKAGIFRRAGDAVPVAFEVPAGASNEQVHRLMVRDAIAAGLPVPAEVLAEYPDLQPPAERPEDAVEVEKSGKVDAGDTPRVEAPPTPEPAVEEGGPRVREGGQAEVDQGAPAVAEEEAGAAEGLKRRVPGQQKPRPATFPSTSTVHGKKVTRTAISMPAVEGESQPGRLEKIYGAWNEVKGDALAYADYDTVAKESGLSVGEIASELKALHEGQPGKYVAFTVDRMGNNTAFQFKTKPTTAPVAAEAGAAEKQPWEMTREEYFNEPDRVQRDAGAGDAAGWKVSYKYNAPGPAGPTKGSQVMTDKPAKGSTIPAMFGRATVTSVSRAKKGSLDTGELFEEGKKLHRQFIEDALAAGQPVPAEVVAEYPDLKPEAGAAEEVTEREYVIRDRTERPYLTRQAGVQVVPPDQLPPTPSGHIRVFHGTSRPESVKPMLETGIEHSVQRGGIAQEPFVSGHTEPSNAFGEINVAFDVPVADAEIVGDMVRVHRSISPAEIAGVTFGPEFRDPLIAIREYRESQQGKTPDRTEAAAAEEVAAEPTAAQKPPQQVAPPSGEVSLFETEPSPPEGEARDATMGMPTPLAEGNSDPPSVNMPMRLEPPPGNAPTRSAPQVIDALADVASGALGNVPIRVGRIVGKGSRAIFKERPEVIRLRSANDITAAAHEVGHAIHKGAMANTSHVPPANVVSELAAIGRRLYGDQQPAAGYEHEGAAELTRMMLTDPAAARRQSPNATAWFNATLDGLGIRKQFDKARKLAQEFADEGAANRGRAGVVGLSEADRRTPTQIAVAVRETAGRAFGIQTQVEALQPILEFQREAERRLGRELKPMEQPFFTASALRLTHSARVRDMVDKGMIDLAGNRVGPALAEIRPLIKGRANDFVVYLWARRAEALWLDPNKPGGRNPGLSLADAQQILAEFENPKFQLAAQKFYDWNEGVLNYVAQASPDFAARVEQIRAVDPGSYIPLAREFRGLDELWSQRSGTGVLGQPAVQRLRGSGRRIKNPIETAIARASQQVRAAHQRVVLDQMIRLSKVEGMGHIIEKLGTPSVPVAQRTVGQLVAEINKTLKRQGVETEIEGESLSDVIGETITFFAPAKRLKGGEPIVSIWEDGKAQFYRVNAPLYDAMMDMSGQTGADWIGHWTAQWALAKPARAFRAGTTGLRASFGLITNPTRDASTMWVNSQANANSFQLMHAWAASLGNLAVRGRKDPYIDAFFRMGAQMAQPLGLDIPQTRLAAKAVTGGPRMSVLNPGRWFDWYRQLIQLPESAPRIAELRKVADDVGWTPGTPMTMEQSLTMLLAAKQVTTDFTAAGTFGRSMNQIVPFWNAAVQGPRANIRAAGRNPMRFAMRGLGLAAATLALWWLYKDEDWYIEMPWREKALFWHVPLKIDSMGIDEIIRIPRPFEAGMVFAAMPEMFMDAMYRQDPEAAVQWMKTFAETTAPNPLPVVIEEAGEQLANKDFFWERPIVSQRLDPKAPEEQITPYTSHAAVVIGDLFKVSPARVDHAIRGIYGGVAGDVMALTGLGPPDNPRDSEAADIPVLGRLFMRGGPAGTRPRSVDDAYDRLEKAIQRQHSSRQTESEHQRQLRLMLTDATRAVSLMFMVRGVATKTFQRRTLTEEARNTARRAVEKFDAGKVDRDTFQYIRKSALAAAVRAGVKEAEPKKRPKNKHLPTPAGFGKKNKNLLPKPKGF